jgi:type II secretory pathway component GspD/PulD (secretin)
MLLMAAGAAAQTAVPEPRQADAKPAPEIYQIFYLANVSQQNDLNDVQQAVRNTLPRARVYSAPFQNALLVRGTAEDMALAKQVIADLDRPRKTYRLTYTITETDAGKRTGTQHLTLIAISGEKANLKQGSRVPLVTGNLATGNSDSGNSAPGPQVQYVDVGESVEVRLEGASEGLRLHSKLEQSSVADEKSGLGAQDPVFRQTVFEATAVLVPGKPLVLGSFDVPGSTLRREVEVVAEALR